MAVDAVQPSQEEEMVHASFKLKDLPQDVQKRFRLRVKKREKLSKQQDKLWKEEQKDLKNFHQIVH